MPIGHQIGCYKIKRKYDGLFSNGTTNHPNNPLKFTKYGRNFKSLYGIKRHLECAIWRHSYYSYNCCVVRVTRNGFEYIGDINISASIEKDKLNWHWHEVWAGNKDKKFAREEYDRALLKK